MWIFTKDSLLMPATFPRDKVAPAIAALYDIQVRSRDRFHLEQFIDSYMDVRECSGIHATPKMDYEFRFYTTKRSLERAVGCAVLDIDYEKFKPEAESPCYHSLLNKIWGVVYDHYRGRGNDDVQETW